MKGYFGKITVLAVLFMTACNNTKTEKNISGKWKAETISLVGDSADHKLNDIIQLTLDYPDYSFTNGEITESGSYLVDNDGFLNLQKISDSVPNVRKIEILKFANDSLELLLRDSLSQRKVLFLR